MHRKGLIAVASVLIAGGVLASMGKEDKTVDLSSAGEIWSDILRDADQVGLQATRMPATEEIRIGNDIAAGLGSWAPEDPGDTAYVTAVAKILTPGIRRRDIPYRFHVIESPSLNAFAIPGGHVYVLRGMMDFLENEAELAAILGHEISHVDLRHCVERYQYRHAFQKIGAGTAGAVIDFARTVLAIGYTQYQEYEADAAGARMAMEAGYDPAAARAVFQRLQQMTGERPRRRAATPAGEVGQAVENAITDYFRTHPRSSDRIRRIEAVQEQRRIQGRQFYIGSTNFAQRVAMSSRQAPSEWRTY